MFVVCLFGMVWFVMFDMIMECVFGVCECSLLLVVFVLFGMCFVWLCDVEW